MPALNLCCPKCLAAGVRTQLAQNGHEVQCTADGTHKFLDTAELTSYPLEPFNGKAFTPPPPKPPPSAVTLNVTIDSKINAALQSRFGDKLDASLISIVSVLADPGAFVVNGEDARRMSEKSGQPIKDGMTLAGTLFNGFENLRLANEEVKALRANSNGSGSGVSGDCVQVQLSMENVIRIAEKAAFQGKSIKALLAETLVFALDQGWF